MVGTTALSPTSRSPTGTSDDEVGDVDLVERAQGTCEDDGHDGHVEAVGAVRARPERRPVPTSNEREPCASVKVTTTVTTGSPCVVTSGGSSRGTSATSSLSRPADVDRARSSTDSSWRIVRVLAAHGHGGRHDRDVVDALAAGRLPGELRQHRDGRVGELAGDVGADPHAGRVDVDAGHDGAQLVEGLEARRPGRC